MKKRYSTISAIVFLLILATPLVSCKGNQDKPGLAVEAYIRALVDRDSVKAVLLSCADWEQNATAEVDSFTAVSSKIENLSCKQSGTNGDDTYVLCTGEILLDYIGEAQTIDLSTRAYITRQEDGEWRMCGYH